MPFAAQVPRFTACLVEDRRSYFLRLPRSRQALVAVTRIPGLDSTTKVVLTAKVIADIFLGNITTWRE
jgi:ABC-type phosphate transport system substrate-binding protein